MYIVLLACQFDRFVLLPSPWPWKNHSKVSKSNWLPANVQTTLSQLTGLYTNSTTTSWWRTPGLFVGHAVPHSPLFISYKSICKIHISTGCNMTSQQKVMIMITITTHLTNVTNCPLTYMLGTIMGAGNTTVNNNAASLPFWGLQPNQHRVNM